MIKDYTFSKVKLHDGIWSNIVRGFYAEWYLERAQTIRALALDEDGKRVRIIDLEKELGLR